MEVLEEIDLSGFKDHEKDLLIHILDKFERCTVVVAEMLIAQRLADIGQNAHRPSTSPLIAFSFTNSDYINSLDEKVENIAKERLLPKVLIRLGEEYPKQEYLVFSNERAYLETYEEFLTIKQNNPDNYREVIENSIGKSTFYPYKGSMRPQFRKKGIVSEVMWISERLLYNDYGWKHLVKYYNKQDDIYFQGYPHEGNDE